ncbi:MAG: metallophosphoesterase, partial [bacterium]|nr:metallophosphoesterase [bacterium]
FGNCDGNRSHLTQVFNTIGGEISRSPARFSLEGKNIVMMHEPFWLLDAIRAGETDYVFYGHMHEVDCRKINSTLILNPGDSGGSRSPATFFVMDIADGSFEQICL